jgi:hypothetical protein
MHRNKQHQHLENCQSLPGKPVDETFQGLNMHELKLAEDVVLACLVQAGTVDVADCLSRILLRLEREQIRRLEVTSLERLYFAS